MSHTLFGMAEWQSMYRGIPMWTRRAMPVKQLCSKFLGAWEWKVRGVRASSKVVFCVQDIFNTNTKATPAGRVTKSLQATLVVYFKICEKFCHSWHSQIIWQSPRYRTKSPDLVFGSPNPPIFATFGVSEGHIGIFDVLSGSVANLYFKKYFNGLAKSIPPQNNRIFLQVPEHRLRKLT